MKDKIIGFRHLAESQLTGDNSQLAKEILVICDTLDSNFSLFSKKTEKILKRISPYRHGDPIKWTNKDTGTIDTGHVQSINIKPDGDLWWSVQAENINGMEVHFRHIINIVLCNNKLVEMPKE